MKSKRISQSRTFLFFAIVVGVIGIALFSLQIKSRNGILGVTTISPTGKITLYDNQMQTTQNTTAVAETVHPIKWYAPHAQLLASNFAITLGKERFFGIPDPGTQVQLSSNPISNNYTTFEAIWTEKKKQMRLFIYFYRDNRGWWTNEQRTYDGSLLPDWVYYDTYFANQNNIAFKAKSLTIATTLSSEVSGTIRFDNLQLLPFTNEN